MWWYKFSKDYYHSSNANNNFNNENHTNHSGNDPDERVDDSDVNKSEKRLL